jgi:hypothetical protein
MKILKLLVRVRLAVSSSSVVMMVSGASWGGKLNATDCRQVKG